MSERSGNQYLWDRDGLRVEVCLVVSADSDDVI